MPKDDKVYVGHMLDMAHQARQLVAGKTRADYDADLALRLALVNSSGDLGLSLPRNPFPQAPAQRGQVPLSWVLITGNTVRFTVGISA
jgi:hypothetical protein